MSALLDKLFRDHDTLVGGRKGRWIVIIVALALGGILAFAPGGKDEQLNHIVGPALLAFGALTFLYALLCEYLIAREGASRAGGVGPAGAGAPRARRDRASRQDAGALRRISPRKSAERSLGAITSCSGAPSRVQSWHPVAQVDAWLARSL